VDETGVARSTRELAALALVDLDAPPTPEVVEARPVEGITGLLDDVLGTVGRPVDTWAVAATLESFGLRDVDAARYGERDIFSLADRVYAACREHLRDKPDARPSLSSSDWRSQTRRFLHFYAKGTFFALPMVIQMFSVLGLGYALWSDLRFDAVDATTVSIGTILSFVVTGGFVQAIGRLGRFYLQQEAFLLAREICWRLIRLGGVVTLAIGALLWGVNALGGWLPPGLALDAAVYYVLLSTLWLTLAVLYTLEQQLRIVVCIVFGIGVIAAVRAVLPSVLYVDHWIGLAATILLVAALAKRGLDQRAGGPGSTMVALPRPALLSYLVSPYYVYGALYFSFLFLDRVVGWTAGDNPLFIWFNTPYEIGLDVALLAMVLPLAQLEYTIHAFSEQVVDVQKSFDGHDIAAHNRFFGRFYLRQVALLGLLASASAPVVLLGFVALGDVFPAVSGITEDPVMLRVFWIGALGYGLLVLALMNGVFFFSLSRVAFVLRGLVLGLVVNVCVGAVLSRHLEFWWSVVGLVAGTLTFAVVTLVYAVRVVRRMDYYYFSAF
jgi:hypothetical protein